MRESSSGFPVSCLSTGGRMADQFFIPSRRTELGGRFAFLTDCETDTSSRLPQCASLVGSRFDLSARTLELPSVPTTHTDRETRDIGKDRAEHRAIKEKRRAESSGKSKQWRW